jgi:hypothetical protein
MRDTPTQADLYPDGLGEGPSLDDATQ